MIIAVIAVLSWNGVTMSDLINRNQAIEVISKLPVKVDNLGYTWMIAGDVLNQIDEIPSAEPERPKGEWKPDESGNVYWICSICGFASEAFGADILYHFCPRCGADMRGKNEKA